MKSKTTKRPGITGINCGQTEIRADDRPDRSREMCWEASWGGFGSKTSSLLQVEKGGMMYLFYLGGSKAMSAQTGEGNKKQTRAAMLWHKKRYTARTVRVGRRKPLDWKSSQPLLVDKSEGRALSAGWSFCACSEGSLEGSAGWDSHKFHFPLSTFHMSTLSCVHPGPDAPADGRKGDLILFVQRGSNTGGPSQASCCAAVEGCAVRARMVRMEKSGHRIVRWLQPTGRVLEPPGACDGAGSPHQRPGWRWCWCKSFGVETPSPRLLLLLLVLAICGWCVLYTPYLG